MFETCFLNFGQRFRSILGAILGLKRVMKRQDGPKKDLKSLKVPKNNMCKNCDFSLGKQCFSSLGGSQDEHKRLKNALKRDLKSFKTRQKSVPTNCQKMTICWTSCGTDLGPKLNPKNYKKHNQTKY